MGSCDSTDNVNSSHCDDDSSPPIDGISTILSLHAYHNFSRKDVTRIITFIDDNVLQPVVRSFENYFRQILSVGDSPNSINLNQRAEFAALVDKTDSLFSDCRTERQLLSWLRNHDLLANFHEYMIDERIHPMHRNGEMHFNVHRSTGILMPLSFQFRRFFEIHDNFALAMKEMSEHLNNHTNIPQHLICGSSWQSKVASLAVSSDSIVMPLLLYIDDVEINNPLGGHTCPLTFIYYSFPLIPDCQIFLGSVFEAANSKRFGNENCLTNLVLELKRLEIDGVEIKTSHGIKTIRFVLAMVLGDNLGHTFYYISSIGNILH